MRKKKQQNVFVDVRNNMQDTWDWLRMCESIAPRSNRGSAKGKYGRIACSKDSSSSVVELESAHHSHFQTSTTDQCAENQK